MWHDGRAIKIAVVGGLRIPFCRAHTNYASCSNQDMMTAALAAIVQKFDLKGQVLGDVALGAVIKHSRDWNLARESWSQPGPGHIMKVRYTSLQHDAGAAEEQHPDLPGTVAGLPVVACSLHSQVAVVAAVARHLVPTARIAYVMTDGAGLPIVLSDLVHELRGAGVIDVTVTAGHAFGGDLEAVAVPSALALARHVADADLVVVGMGPGVVGTGSVLGTTAVEVAGIIDAALIQFGDGGGQFCADLVFEHLGVERSGR